MSGWPEYRDKEAGVDGAMTDIKTKFDFEIEEFTTNFHNKKDKKIVLYGTGRMTATLLERLQGYHIVGLLDRDPAIIGKKYYGLKVLSREEAEEQADLIIINTSESYWNVIYQRISDWNVPVYYRNGKKAYFPEESDQEEPYWSKSYQQLREQVQAYDVVSFDIFNTLLMRRLYLPIDVFLVVENKLQRIYGKDIAFVEWRKRASAVLDNPSIDEIYVKLMELTGWDEKLAEEAKAFELEAEQYFISPRHDMVELYREICQEKEVFLISDMYYPKEILGELLKQKGIQVGLDHLLISCDTKKSKESGELWKYYSQRIIKGRKAIHVGDEEEADGNQPRKYGIESWLIWSPAMLLQHSSLKMIVPHIQSLRASVVIGFIEYKLFNSPFSLNETKGKVIFKNEKDAGYCLLGNLLCEFFQWLLTQAKSEHVQQLAFFAREGYLLTGLFDEYCSLIDEADAPESVYMEISRRAVMTASIRSERDARDLLEFPYRGSAADFLKDRFGLKITDRKLCETQWSVFSGTEQMKDELFEHYSDFMLEEAEWERRNYIKYLSGLELKKDFAIVDSQLYGTTQYYLGKILDRRVRGYYFCVCLEETNRYLEENIMKGCFRAEDGKSSNIYKQAPFIEAFFTAPNGMFECIDEYGNKRYAKKMRNQKNFDIRYEMMEGIREFMKDMLHVQREQTGQDRMNDTLFADLLFGVFMNNGFKTSERMKESFWYDNRIAGSGEVPVWE